MGDKVGRCIITSWPRLALHNTASSFLLKLIIEQIRYCGIFISLRVKHSGWHLSNYEGLMICKNLSPLLKAKNQPHHSLEGEKIAEQGFPVPHGGTRRRELAPVASSFHSLWFPHVLVFFQLPLFWPTSHSHDTSSHQKHTSKCSNHGDAQGAKHTGKVAHVEAQSPRTNRVCVCVRAFTVQSPTAARLNH